MYKNSKTGAPTARASAVCHRLGKSLLFLAIASTVTHAAWAQSKISDDIVKVGVLTDMSGAYADFTGQGAVIAAMYGD